MNDNHTEQELATRSRNGDQKAQMELYDRHFRSVFRSALRVVGNAEEAEEVAQESFLKFFTCKGSDPSNVEAMIRRIAINGAIDALRRRKIDFMPLTVDLPTVVEEPQHWGNVRVEELIFEIGRLADPYRTTLTLNLIEGLDYDEIADYLKIRASTVRSHVSRAKKMLIAQFNKG